MNELGRQIGTALPEPAPTFFDELREHLETSLGRHLGQGLLETRIGGGLREWLLREVQQGQPDKALAAASYLAELNEPRMVEALQPRLATSSTSFRAEAARLLGRMEGSTPVLEALMSDIEAQVRASAAWSLGAFHHGGAESMLRSALADSDAGVRQAAITALQQVAGSAASADARYHLHDKDASVRAAAVQVLAAAPMVEDLALFGEMIMDNDAKVRSAVAVALGAMVDNAGMPLLRKLLDDDDSDVRRSALGGLAAAANLSEVDRRLLSAALDGYGRWIDVREAVTRERLKKATKALGVPPEEIIARLNVLSGLLGCEFKVPTTQ